MAERGAEAARATPVLVSPAWPAPATVGACFTTRLGGVSVAPFDTLNLAMHVGDDPARVAENRARLRAALGPGVAPCWLDQVHGSHVVRLDDAVSGCAADAAITTRPGLACAVMVADCVPVLLCARDGREVAAVHAGWRGLAGGIIGAAVGAFAAAPRALLAWIGPCIGPVAYAVGDDVRRQLLAATPHGACCFARTGAGWQCDLAALAARQLAHLGVTAITRADTCVHAAPTRYYSHRRDGTSGRNAALIWLKAG
ncbi:MAG: peptidoglycan editing factor PgeF [Gammaproteobacteria bacterium]